MIRTAITFIRENPVLAALLAFVFLALDSLYVYRTLKRFWKRSPRSYRDRS